MQYINLSQANHTEGLTNVKMSLTKSPYIVNIETVKQRGDEIYLAVDRFNLKSCVLPIFQDTNMNAEQIKLIDVSGDPWPPGNWTVNVDFSAYTDADGFIFNIDSYINAIQAAFDTLKVNAALSYGFTVSYDKQTRLVKLEYDALFDNNFELYISAALYKQISWAVEDIHYSTLSSGFLKVVLPDATEIVTINELDVNPVTELLMVTSTIPVKSEMINNGDTSVGSTKSIITDYAVPAYKDDPFQDINFKSTQYRFHEIYGTFENAEVTFEFTTHTGNYYPLKMLKHGQARAKLFLKTVKSK